jgi:hypothetical protein
MNFRIVCISIAAAAVAVAQTESQRQTTSHSEEHQSQTTTTRSGQKGPWTGTLVDASCTGPISHGSMSPSGKDRSQSRSSSSSSQSNTSSADREQTSTSRTEEHQSESTETSGMSNRHWSDDRVKSCAPTSATSDFGLVSSDGRFYKLDSAGDSLASKAWKNSGQRSGRGPDVTVEGTLQGDTIAATSVR